MPKASSVIIVMWNWYVSYKHYPHNTHGFV